MIAVFSPGSGVLDGDEFGVTAAVFFAASIFALLGLLTAGAVGAFADDEAATGAAAAGSGAEFEAGAFDGAGEADVGADAGLVAESGDVEDESVAAAGVGEGAGAAGAGCGEGFVEAGEGVTGAASPASASTRSICGCAIARNPGSYIHAP
jgi:hypothetical protein